MQLIKNLLIQKRKFLVINFNYTNTFELIRKKVASSIVRKDFNEQPTEHNVHYVHGALKKNKIVLGVGNEFAIEKDLRVIKKDFENEPIVFYSSIDFIKDRVEAIFIYGHSLGKEDKFYFDKFFEFVATVQVKTNIQITYHGDSDLERLKQNLIEYSSDKLNLLKNNRQIKVLNTADCKNFYFKDLI